MHLIRTVNFVSSCGSSWAILPHTKMCVNYKLL